MRREAAEGGDAAGEARWQKLLQHLGMSSGESSESGESGESGSSGSRGSRGSRGSLRESGGILGESGEGLRGV